MRILVSTVLAGAILATTSAAAQPAAGDAATAAPAKLCTTTTTVVRRGDVVISSNTTTKCEDETGPHGGVASAVFSAPAGAVSTFGKFMGSGANLATASNVRGDWKVMDSHAQRICHLFLTSQPDPAGFRVRRTDCQGDMSRPQTWTFQDGGVALHAQGGEVVARLGGTRDQLDGQTAAGNPLQLQR